MLGDRYHVDSTSHGLTINFVFVSSTIVKLFNIQIQIFNLFAANKPLPFTFIQIPQNQKIPRFRSQSQWVETTYRKRIERAKADRQRES